MSTGPLPAADGAAAATTPGVAIPAAPSTSTPPPNEVTPAMNDTRAAPETVGWYIELTKWMLGIAAGVLVFGFDKLAPDALGVWPFRAFVAAVVLLVIAFVAGVIGTMQLLAYANRRESGLARNETAADVERYRRRGTLGYQWCGRTLAVGLIAFAYTWGSVWFADDRATTGAPVPVVVAAPGTTNGLVLRPGTDGRAPEVLVHGPDGALSWAPLPAPPPGPAVAPPADAQSPSTVGTRE